jgi:hypothetical protein
LPLFLLFPLFLFMPLFLPAFKLLKYI